MNAIASRKLPDLAGFAFRAEMHSGDDSSPDDFECYSPDDIAAYKRGDWGYVGIVVTASRAGVDLGDSSVWSMECGVLADGQVIDPLKGDVDGDDFANGYGPGLIAEALKAARAKLAELHPRRGLFGRVAAILRRAAETW